MRTVVGRLVIAMVALAGLWACGGAPAQIVDYSPLRSAQNVPTVQPVKITFDHAVDQQSVASRLHLSPDVTGSIRWLDDRSLEYDHVTLDPGTIYEVILESGYSDAAGNVYVLRHHWSFTTEAAPTFAASSPADGSTRIDPADYLTVDFTHTMNPDTLRSAISFSPQVSFGVRLDPTNDLRAIVAPNALLDPNTDYTLLITTAALDVDGNQLDRVHTVHFATGGVSALHHWIAFATLSAAGESGGLWIVNESGFPRELLGAGLVQSFHWSPDGSRIVYQSESGDWSSWAPGGQPEQLDFSGSWAAALASGDGYAYLDAAGTLHHEAADKSTEVVASDVDGAAVSPDGRRIAYTQQQPDGTTLIWGYDVSLRSHYVLADEKGEVSDLAWAPDGARLAYLRSSDTNATSLRVLGLAGSASISTIATGELGPPEWLRDSDHLVIEATVQASGGTVTKAFVINVASPPASLTVSLGLPADPDIEVADPTPSPDGHQIAFVSGNQVWLMNADGTRPTPLTRYEPGSFPYSCLMPAWTRS
jgi:Tol biopolymer transport system component